MRIARFLWPGLAAALLGLPVATALLQRVPNINDFEIVTPAPEWRPVFVALGNHTADDGTHTAQKALWQGGPDSLLAHDEVRLLTVTYGGRLTLLHGEIRVPGTDCVYQTPPGAALINTGYLAFTRTSNCNRQGDDSRQLDLTVTFRGDGHMGLATYFVPPTTSIPSWLSLTAPNPTDPRPVPVVRGRYVDVLDGPSVRRADLLAYVWHIKGSSLWIWAVVGVALIAVFAGMVCVEPGAPAPSSLRLAVSAGCIALAFALLYAVLVPPLQAPDEPDHMLAFALVAGPQQADSLAALARRGHFDRIHFGPSERFRPVDVARPSAVQWGSDVFAHNVAGRSLTTWAWWTLLAPAIGDARASTALLVLRLANAWVFAVGLALATALLLATSLRRAVAPHAICLALLLVPTLPFFATHVSEFALLTSTYIVLAAIVAALFLDGDRTHWLGLPLGVAASVILAGGRSGLPFVATMAAAIAGRALLGSANAEDRDGLRRALIFWIGLATGLAIFALLATPEFRDGLWPGDAGRVPDQVRWAAELIRSHPSVIGIVIPIGLALELCSTWLRARVPEAGWLTGLVKVICGAAATAVVASVVYSAFASFPRLSFVESTQPASAAAYAWEVLGVAATSLRITGHDWLLSASFWAGFGWLDTLPGDRFVSVLVLLTALALTTLLVRIARAGDRRRAAWLLVLSVGWIVTVILYAVSSYYLHRNLHGRYLVGLYLSMLAICGSTLALAPRRTRPSAWWLLVGREGAVVAVAAAIHGYALRFILLRYF